MNPIFAAKTGISIRVNFFQHPFFEDDTNNQPQEKERSVWVSVTCFQNPSSSDVLS